MDKSRIEEFIGEFIIEKVRQNTSPDRPYYFIRGSGLNELCQSYGLNLLAVIDKLVEQGKVKKALINGKLAIFIYKPLNKRKLQEISQEFEQFLKSKNNS